MNKQALIELKNISKVYTKIDMETHALRNINMAIYQGDYISISGPSGCGKSTLLSILGLLDTPTDGSYLIKGQQVANLTSDDRAEIRNLHIGFIFQAFNLIDEISVYDNVALPLKYREPKLSSQEIDQRVMASLEKVDMQHRCSHNPNQLSGGQQQRIAIARALVGKPNILLVDEPTGNLDSKNGDLVMALLDNLNKEGTTICMVTHDPRYANHAKIKLNLLDGIILDNIALDSSLDSLLDSALQEAV